MGSAVGCWPIIAIPADIAFAPFTNHSGGNAHDSVFLESHPSRKVRTMQLIAGMAKGSLVVWLHGEESLSSDGLLRRCTSRAMRPKL